MIDALRDVYRLSELLELLKMPKSSYFYCVKRRATDKYAGVRSLVAQYFCESNKCYGYRRIYASIRKTGLIISEKIIRRIMREDGLAVSCPSRKKYSSYQGEISPAVDNIIKRNFHAEQPNQKWLTDITEFAIPAGKIYLSPIIDCFDGMVVSWTIGTSPNAELANSMLENAILTLQQDERPIVHSDRGSHYRWPGWINRMNTAGLTRSMSKKGCSPDNAACEGFFGRLKNEMFYNRLWGGITIEQFIEQLDSYIHWYNEKRIKISLGGLSPVEYRQNLGLI